MEAFIGKYERVSKENYNNTMRQLGVGRFLRFFSWLSEPVEEISFNSEENIWTIERRNLFSRHRVSFSLNKEFDETTADGRQVRTLVTFRDGKIFMRHNTKISNLKNTRSIRELNSSGKEMTYTHIIEITNTTCVEKFERYR